MILEAAGESSVVFGGDIPSDTNIVLGNILPADAQALADLRWLQTNSAGVEQYLQDCVLTPDTILTSASGAYGLAVSEHMLALTMALIRHLPAYFTNQKNHVWDNAGSIISVEGSTIVILGLGDIGSCYARKVKALGAHTIGVRRHPGDPVEGVDEIHTIDELNTLLPQADLVASVLPGGSATYHMMNEERLALMKDGAYLINCGRGTFIDPEALLEALESGHLAGAAIDVTEPEPLPESSPLWDAPHLIITPHVAGNFYLEETKNRVVRIMCRNLKAFLNGEDIINVIGRRAG